MRRLCFPSTASASNKLVTESGNYPKVFVSGYHGSEAVYKFTVSASTQTHFLINVGYGGDILLGVHTRDDRITAIQLGSQNGSTSRASMPTIKVSSDGLIFYVRVGSDTPLSITQLYPTKYSNVTVTMESVTSSDSGYTSASIVTIRRVIVNSDVTSTVTSESNAPITSQGVANYINTGTATVNNNNTFTFDLPALSDGDAWEITVSAQTWNATLGFVSKYIASRSGTGYRLSNCGGATTGFSATISSNTVTFVWNNSDNTIAYWRARYTKLI